MNRQLVISALLLLCLASSGCGTVMRGRCSSHLYPAVHTDGMMYSDFHGMLKETSDPGPDQAFGQFVAYLGFVLTTVDLPISIVTDTVLLPYDLWTQSGEGEQEPNKTQEGIAEELGKPSE